MKLNFLIQKFCSTTSAGEIITRMASYIDVNLPHHVKEELCTTRPVYRQGKKLTSVKVYTVNNESQHLLIYNVPAINIDSEVRSLCQRYGAITTCDRVPAQDIEDFTNVYHVRFEKVYHARNAKRKLDNLSFFGGILHVCYAPELETVEETKEKLSTRRKEVSYHLKELEFPKQFRPQRGHKRKFRDKDFSQSTFLATTFSTKDHEQYEKPQEHFIPRSSEENKVLLPVIDTKPFKKLIPTQVSRIVFHNIEKTNKT